jgi:hypothetical protein
MPAGLDYRVRLDFAYIPKNAYESLTFFRVVEKCANWISPPTLSRILTRRWWDAQEVFQTTRRPSSKTKRGPTEVLRDILDLATYLGFLDKRWSREDARVTEFKLTSEGEEICRMMKQKDPMAQEKLIRRFLEYRIPNSQIDTTKYFQYKDFSVRPFFVMLKLLHDFEKDLWTEPGRPRFHPKELGYVVLSVREESEASFRQALERMQAIAGNGVLRSGNWNLLKRMLSEDNYSLKEFDRKTNNLRTRLFRWPFVMGLIDCRTNIPEADEASMYTKLKGIRRKGEYQVARISEVIGLTSLGKKTLEPLLDSVYVYSGLTNADKILSVALSRYKGAVDKVGLEEFAIRTKIYRQSSDFQYGLERLQSRQIVNSNGTVQIQLLPFFEVQTDAERSEVSKKSAAILRLLGQAERPTRQELEAGTAEAPVVPRVVEARVPSGRRGPEQAYIVRGADPRLHDYLRLSLGDRRLTANYSDIRMEFEAKTELVLKQLSFKTELYGQSVKRGESYPDIVAIWNRLVRGIDATHLTIIECKTSASAYNMTLKDIDDRIRQTRNLLAIERYQKYGLKALIDSVLFVSSSFGLGENRQKMRELKERYRQELHMSVRVAAISAKTLLELYVLYREEPSKFNDFDFTSLFREEIISVSDVRPIFGA